MKKQYCLTVFCTLVCLLGCNQLPINLQYNQYGEGEYDIPIYPIYPTTNVQNSGNIVTLLNEKIEEEKTVSAIIVTFVAGSSYDQLFSTHEQKSAEGTQTLVFAAYSNGIPRILSAMKDSSNETDRQLLIMVDQINQLEKNCPACIVFNWQCSSGYSQYRVAEGQETLNEFLKLLLDRGYMTMFSDFSLKALIGGWDEQKLGPNPFKQIQTTNDPIDLRFKNSELINSPSTQLQIVGKLAQNGNLKVNVLGGTIVYGVDSEREQTDQYELQILTIAADHRTNQRYMSQIGDYRGTAGHVLLKYKSGGLILTSMGHWIELLKIDTSETTFFQVARQTFGDSYAADIQAQYDVAETKEEKQSLLQKISGQLIYQNSPGANYKGKG